MRLMIVDDHAPTRAMIRDFVGHLASSIVECDNGEAAMRHCLQQPPDVISLDLRIGVVDGLAVLEFVRNVCPNVHVVVVTQFDEPEVRILVKRQGAVRCFAKSELPELRHYLERWRYQQLDSANDSDAGNAAASRGKET